MDKTCSTFRKPGHTADECKKDKKDGSKDGKDKKRKCQFCGFEGHNIVDCRKLKGAQQQLNRKPFQLQSAQFQNAQQNAHHNDIDEPY
ncbi:hypothetical protein BGX38DRAFT_1223501 [Terfezia claveryi]|nr:hypothetical protein BGX38DRAFT_1223501 [Terfezia claveryi]